MNDMLNCHQKFHDLRHDSEQGHAIAQCLADLCDLFAIILHQPNQTNRRDRL